VSERKLVLEKTKSENERLKRELAEAQTPEYIEAQAREKLNMVKEGEKIVLMPNQSIGNAGDLVLPLNENNGDNSQENIANWKKWWRLFF